MHLLTQLGEIAAPGSSAEVIYDPRLFAPEDLRLPTFDALDVTMTANTGTWRLAQETRTSHLTAIVLLAQRGATSPVETDSRTLLTHMLPGASWMRAVAGRPGSSWSSSTKSTWIWSASQAPATSS